MTREEVIEKASLYHSNLCDDVNDDRTLFEMMADFALSVHSKWISVKDRLPTESKRYLLWHESDGIMDVVLLSKYDKHWKADLDFLNATHWMELPEPPQP